MSFSQYEKPGLKLGAHSYCGLQFSNHFNIPVKVGNFTSMAGGVTIIGMRHPGIRDNCVSTFPFKDVMNWDYPDCTDRGRITIGNDVWIGMNATILSGVTIGDGAVIGACCVVTKNVDPYAVVVGNPNRFLWSRFSERQVAALLAIEWWYWPDDLIKQRMPDFSDIDTFIKKYGVH